MHAEHPLSTFGWSDRVRALASDCDHTLEPARVARVDRGWLTAVSALGSERLPVRGLDVTTGDWILISRREPPSVEVVLPRWSLLGRHDPGRSAATQHLAANVDVGFVVMGLDRPVKTGRLERLVTLVWSGGAVPVVVLTKVDLVGDATLVTARVTKAAGGADVVVASCRSGEGIDRVRELVPAGQTGVLLGESGAGKSSIVNALAGAEVQATGAVRGDHKGRHTTRARELVPVPGAGVLIDTPGLRGVGLAGGHDSGLDRSFTDVVALAESCRFRDCRHRTEPGCAVQAAVADGRLDAARLTSYEALQREIASAARRADVRADRAAARAWGRRSKQVMEHTRRTRPRR